jgi:hypothetical protein
MIKKLLLIFFIFALGGCASTPTNKEMALYPPSGEDNRMSSLLSENYVEGHTVISFPYNLSVADDFMVAKETDAKSLVLEIRRGRILFSRGRRSARERRTCQPFQALLPWCNCGVLA